MVKQVIKNRAYLHSLIKSTPQKRKLLIKAATPDQLRSVFEATLNVANRNVPIRSNSLSKLRKYKSAINRVAFSKAHKTKRKILIQNGGFLPVLLSTVLGYLANQIF